MTANKIWIVYQCIVQIVMQKYYTTECVAENENKKKGKYSAYMIVSFVKFLNRIGLNFIFLCERRVL